MICVIFRAGALCAVLSFCSVPSAFASRSPRAREPENDPHKKDQEWIENIIDLDDEKKLARFLKLV
jgi:hypothetical protein